MRVVHRKGGFSELYNTGRLFYFLGEKTARCVGHETTTTPHSFMPEDASPRPDLPRWVKLKQRFKHRPTSLPVRTLIVAQQVRAESSSPTRPPRHDQKPRSASDSHKRRHAVHFHDLPVPRRVSQVMLSTKQNPLSTQVSHVHVLFPD
jgi:hypothetical protein